MLLRIPTLSMFQRGINLFRFMNSKSVDIMIFCKQHNEMTLVHGV